MPKDSNPMLSPDQLRATEPAVLEALLASRSKRRAVRIPFKVPYVLLPAYDDDGQPVMDPDTQRQAQEELFFECAPVEGSVIDECTKRSIHPPNTRPADHELNCRVVLAATTDYFQKKWWKNDMIRRGLGVGENWQVIDQLLEAGDVQQAAQMILEASHYGTGQQLERAKSPGSPDGDARNP